MLVRCYSGNRDYVPGSVSFLDGMQGFQLIMDFLLMPLFFLSGALFPLLGLPKAIDLIARIDPLSYGIDALSGLPINAGHYGLGIDVIVLEAVTLAFL